MVLGLTWCVSDRDGDIQGSVTGVGRAEGCCGLFAPACHGLTREVCVVATPISTDQSAFPLLLEGDIILPGGSSGRQ